MHSIHRSSAHPSMLMLPVLSAPAEGQRSPPPRLLMLEDATAAQFEESTPIYTIEEDVIGERTTVRTASQRSQRLLSVQLKWPL